jgi:uncharacterized protein YcfJ
METKDIIQTAATVADAVSTTTAAFAESKPWYQSKTILGGAVAIGAAVGGVFGLQLDPTTQQGIVEALCLLGSGFGGLLAIVGRVKAQHKVGG